MAWTIGDRGFQMRLSTYVPELLERNLGPVLDRVLRESGIERSEVDWWGVHPGGRAILDRVQESAEITDAQIAASREVLRNYGNMSSATVLFVLDMILRSSDVADGDTVLAMAFGPGLTIETGLFRVHHPS